MSKNSKYAATEDENEDAFFVPEGSDESGKHDASGMSGEAELVWRCSVCGEMGSIDGIPAECPSCGTSETDLYYCTED